MADATLDFKGRLELAVRSILAPVTGGRAENQDNFIVIDGTGHACFLHDQKRAERTLPNWRAGHCRIAILDGMGGHSFGREATEMAVRGILKIPPSNTLTELSSALDELHLDLHNKMRSTGPQPGCTLTLIEFPLESEPLLYHAGDSRLYEISDSETKFLTVDHVPATKFAMFGLLDKSEWLQQAHFTSGFQISQAFILGNSLNTRDLFGEALESALFELNDTNLPEFLHGFGDRRPLNLRTDRYYLLASDGLWHLTKPVEFLAAWPKILGPGNPERSLEKRLDTLFEALISATNEEPRLRGDNSTAILFRIPEQPTR